MIEINGYKNRGENGRNENKLLFVIKDAAVFDLINHRSLNYLRMWMIKALLFRWKVSKRKYISK